MSDNPGGLDDTGEIKTGRLVEGAALEGSSALERTLPARKHVGDDGTSLDDASLGGVPGPLPAERSGRRSGAGLDRYRLVEEVGQGGMAVVYRARDTTLDREVAVKVLHPHLAGQAESRDRLEREAQAVAKLRHENILEIFDYSGRESDKSFIVTEFIHGTTLRVFMQAQPLPHPEIAELIVSEVARALEHAHLHGVIHRDIKPENVMIRSDGVLKLTDFGIAQIVDKERMTVTGQLLGSPAYMAPEHVEGTGIDFRTDVFAVGILLYQLATGELPFRGKNPHEVLKRIAECTYTPADAVNPRVGRKLSQVIARALSKDKAARYADLGEMRRELLEDLADAGIHEPRAELARLFIDAKSYIQALGPRLVAGLTARGIGLRAAGRRAAALELWRRALEIAPTSGELYALIAGIERQRTIRRVAIGVLALAAIGAGLRFGVPAWRARHPAQKIVENTTRPLPVAVETEKPVAERPDKEPTPAPGKQRVERLVHIAQPPSTEPTPLPKLRHFELVPTPKAVHVLVDGKTVGDYGPALTSLELDEHPHTITFDSPFCYPETIAIAPDAPAARLSRRLKWKPATLTVTTDPSDADILIDGTMIASSGRPVPISLEPQSDGRRTVHVKLSASARQSEQREVVLRANDAQTLQVTLRPVGAP